jgi:parvulin-like peptidyl-prolyl isomerase
MYIKKFDEYHDLSINEGFILKQFKKELIDVFKIASNEISKLWFYDIEDPWEYSKAILNVYYITKDKLLQTERYLYQYGNQMNPIMVKELKSVVKKVKEANPDGIDMDNIKNALIQEINKSKRITKEDKKILEENIKNYENPIDVIERQMKKWMDVINSQMSNNKFVYN